MNTAPVVAVLGYPIHHSKSPKMHRYWLGQAGVSGYYVPLEIHPDNFEDALKNMPKLGFRGANVTIPVELTNLFQCVGNYLKSSLPNSFRNIRYINHKIKQNATEQ